MQKWNDIFKQLSMLSQFGLTLIIPILMCTGFCWWLTTRFGIGGWVFIPGFIFGLGASFMTAYKFYQYQTKGKRKLSEEKKNKHSYNSHI